MKEESWEGLSFCKQYFFVLADSMLGSVCQQGAPEGDESLRRKKGLTRLLPTNFPIPISITCQSFFSLVVAVSSCKYVTLADPDS